MVKFAGDKYACPRKQLDIVLGIRCRRGLLREEHHAPVIDADILARQGVEHGARGYKKIVQAFGEEVILQDGSGEVDRKKLEEIVLGTKEGDGR